MITNILFFNEHGMKDIIPTSPSQETENCVYASVQTCLSINKEIYVETSAIEGMLLLLLIS